MKPQSPTGNAAPNSPTSSAAPAPPIVFASWPQGLARLVDTLADGLTLHLRAPVTGIERTGSGYRVRVDRPVEVDGRAAAEIDADAVLLAVPAPAAARLLTGHVPAAARLLAQTVTAHTATVVLGYPRAAVADVAALTGNGMLIPSTTGTLLKAVTHLSTKWPHLDSRADPDTYLLRMSAGRAGSDVVSRLADDALVARLRADLARLEGVRAEPSHVVVQRWPTGIPQLRVGHPTRLRGAREALARSWPAVQLAGASYDGIGLTSCIASANRAADALAAHLSGAGPQEGRP